MEEFYYFEDLEYQPQLGTKWCWAACGSMISNFHQNMIKDEQEDFVKKKFGRVINSYLKMSDVKELFEEFNIKCVEKDRNFLDNFENVVQELKEGKSPILIGVNVSNNIKHFCLVVGYGTCEGHKYLLIYDPKSKRIFNHYDEDDFEYEGKDISYIWTTYKISNTNNHQLKKLKKTKSINEIIPRFNKFNKKIYDVEFITKSFIRGTIKQETKKVNLFIANNHFMAVETKHEIECNNTIKLILAKQYELYNISKSLIDSNVIDKDKTKITLYTNTGAISITSLSENKTFEKILNIPSYELEEIIQLSPNEYENKYINNQK